MKTITSFVILTSLLFTSCKKDYECKCDIKTTYPRGTVNADGTNFLETTKIVVYKNATRREAKTLCKNHIINKSTGYIIEKECEVKF